jgi:hypothetical protein
VSSYPLLDLFLTMLWFFIWVLWIILVFRIIVDIFRNRELGGWGKAGWLLLIVLVPLLGVLIYLIAHGGHMAQREYGLAQAHDEAYGAHYPDKARGNGSADELTRLAELRDRGVITEEEFVQGKAKALS